MPIPTREDAALAEIDQLANSIKGRLVIMRHAGNARRDFAGLRELLQEYADRVQDFAAATAPN
jgi:hypothetical protein